MDVCERKNILTFVGSLFSDVLNDETSHSFDGYEKISAYNPWFTKDNVKFALKHWSQLLTEHNIDDWFKPYENDLLCKPQKTLAMVFAGNIPLVGLHDFLCCIASGHRILIKLSSKDKILPEWLINQLKKEFPPLNRQIEITDTKFSEFDAVIATGSNNTGRYFEYYFSKYPHIIRKNRNSLAVLSGNETIEEINNLADDIFVYFGLGCRSVSMILVPEGFCFDKIIEVFRNKYADLAYHNKFANNYDYQKAVKLMNREIFMDAGFFLLSQNPQIASPVAVLNYSFYSGTDEVENFLNQNNELLQCVVSNTALSGTLEFGQAQKPYLNEYSDGIDTLKFLLNL